MFRFVWFAGCTFALCSAVVAQPPEGVAEAVAEAAAPESHPDVALIRAESAAYNEAFNQRDAKAVAARFSPQGTFETPGGKTLVGREQIEAAFSAYFAETD
ncbi:MAG: nuclear transport factor 2 family protein, partial [Planctomycetales bacterium]|nr:nuclear transport factor 2 family protein [Planctomycetales bacterium]